MKFQLQILFGILFVFTSLWALDPEKCGIIHGQVLDVVTRQPLVGANVLIVNSTFGAVTNLEGNYEIDRVPVGEYALRFSYVGYDPLIAGDVVVRSNRITYINERLQQKAVALSNVTVRGGYFSKISDQPTSAVNRTFEEIRRAPGSGGDVSRILYSLPSVAKVNDQTNNLIVRGGSPMENAFYIDNIEIPNINHFPTQGASGGPLSLVNVDFIKDVNFYTGGFSSLYGDKLSSIMELSFREGNKEELDGQLDLNFAGFGGVFEGPLTGKKGSWMLSIRRSYIELLAKQFDVGTTAPPHYGDYQGKVTYAINPSLKMMLLAVWGDDHNNPDRSAAEKNDMIYYGPQDIYERTTGMNWQALWGAKGFSNLSLSLTTTDFKEDFSETNTGPLLIKNHSKEDAIKMRNLNTFRINASNTIDLGFEVKKLTSRYNNLYSAHSDALGRAAAGLALNKTLKSGKLGGFFNYTLKPLAGLTTVVGVRYDYFNYNGKGHVSPRGSLSYQLSTLTSLNASAGIFYQNMPMILLAQNAKSNTWQDLQSVHYVMGISHLLSENTKLTIEVYSKQYDHFPMDPDQPGLFLLDEIFYRYGFFFSHENIITQGKAESKGIEISVQKKLADKIYGMAGVGIFKTRYQGLDKTWRDRVFDNRFIFSMEGGYKPSAVWEFSARWIYAGGTPYTPLDVTKSAQTGSDVLDETRLNGSRYPAYHSLNARFDKRFHFQHSNLIFYLSAWNVYDRKNVAAYFWNEKEKKQDVLYQWRLLPIFGLEYEF